MASLHAQPTMVELQLLYFTRQSGGQWIYRTLPISNTHLDSTPASTPKPIHKVRDSGNWDRLCELIDELGKLLATDGAFGGWKIHLLEEAVVINGHYQARVIIMRTLPTTELGPPTSVPSTVVSSPMDSRVEDSAAVGGVRTMLELGTW